MSTTLEDARQALRQRQGAGARYDAPSAPTGHLDLARRGTAYFARLLNDLPDSGLDGASKVPGMSRRQLIAEIAYDARLLGEIIAWARGGKTALLPREAVISEEDRDFGSIQPSHALRYLFEHTAIHLNVEWRDMTDADWGKSVADSSGRVIELRQTPLLRAERIWQSAMALDCGGRVVDMPADGTLSEFRQIGRSPNGCA